MTLGIIIGVSIAVIIGLGSPLISASLNMSELATEYFAQYMLIIALGTPFASVLFCMIACSRGAGDSISPLNASWA